MTPLSDLLQQGAAHAWLFIPSAILLGALHGLEPGHSKTMMAVPGVKFQGYKDWAQIVPELAIGRTDAALFDQPVVSALMKDHPEWKIELVDDYEPRTFKNPDRIQQLRIPPGRYPVGDRIFLGGAVDADCRTTR